MANPRRAVVIGNRANAFLQLDRREDGKWDGIGIYSHWDGTRLHDVVLKHLEKAQARVGDPEYFARILIQNVMNDLFDPNSETGGGLWVQAPGDNEHVILVVNAYSGKHGYNGKSSFRDDIEDSE